MGAARNYYSFNVNSQSMDQSKIWYLENVDLTTLLCPKKLGDALDTHKHSGYKKGDYIYMPEQDSDKVFFLSAGTMVARQPPKLVRPSRSAKK